MTPNIVTKHIDGYAREEWQDDCASAYASLQFSRRTNKTAALNLHGLDITADNRTCGLSERERRQYTRTRKP